MAIYEGSDLSALIDAPETADARRHYHSVDISESVWNRMHELGINQTQLAEMLGKSCSQVSRMLSAQGNMTLQTISELEHALGITLADTTPYVASTATQSQPMPKRTELRSWSDYIDAPTPQVLDTQAEWRLVA
jgi:transcriptional regulator with XRE-family HTH domain